MSDFQPGLFNEKRPIVNRLTEKVRSQSSVWGDVVGKKGLRAIGLAMRIKWTWVLVL